MPKQNNEKFEAADIYPMIKSGTFQVFNRNGQGATGTGFFITPDLMVTNLHVVDTDRDDYPDDFSFISIGTLSDDNQQQYPAQSIVAYDAEHDIALVSFRGPNGPPNVRSLPLENKLPRIGDKVYTLGNPLGQVIGNFTDGTVSKVGRVKGIEPKVFVFTCPISPGNSGGPIVNEFGNVIGVASASSAEDRAQNINIAHPASHITELLRHINQPSNESDQ